MKLKIIKIIVALVLPIILGVLLYQAKIAQGPFYIGNHSDPSYAYLFNSLNLTYGYIPGHVDHPGTTLQYFGAIIIRITYWASGTKTTIIEDVISQPEKYLSIISNAIIVLNVLAFFVLALLADKYFKKIWIGIYLQLIPFFFLDVSFYIYKIMAESVLWIFASYFTFLCIIFWLKSADITNQNKYIFAFSLVVAMGIITKITFIPFAVTPLLLIQDNRKKGYYVLITLLLFILIALPALFSYEYLFHWIKNLLLHSGQYGNGKKNFLEISTFLPNLHLIIKVYLLIPVIIFVITSVIWLRNYVSLKQQNPELNRKISLFLITFLILIVVNSILVAKQYSEKYLTPIICFSFGILSIFYLFLQELYKNKLITQRIISIFCVGLICMPLYNAHTFNNRIAILEDYKQKRMITNEKILNAKKGENTIIIYYYANSSPIFGLAFGISFSGIMKDTYAYYAHKLNPDMIELNVTNNKCYVWNMPIPIAKIIEQKKRILLQGSTLPESYKNTIKIKNSDIDEISFPVKLIFDNQSGECIYELIY